MKLSFRNILLGCVFSLVLVFQAIAGINNPGSGNGGGALPAGAQINASEVTGVFLNALNSASSPCCSGSLTPAFLSTNQLPTGALPSNMGLVWSLPTGAAFTGNSVQWTFVWPASCNLQFTVGISVNFVSSTGSPIISGGTNSNMTVSTGTLAGTATFTFVGFGGGNVSFFFPSGYADSCPSGTLAVVRSNNTNNNGGSDLTAYNAGGSGSYFTPEYIAWFKGLNLSTTRDMGWSVGGSGLDQNWTFRSAPSTINWGSGNRWYSAFYSSSVTYATGPEVYTASPGSGSPANWTDGEFIQLQIPVSDSNTTSTPALAITGHTGSKTIVNTAGGALNAGDLTAGSYYTFEYNAVLGQVIEQLGGYGSGGASVPIEAQVAFSNIIKASLWTVAPILASDSWATSWATYVCSNLGAGLYFYPEYSNEVWNFSGQAQTNLSQKLGQALGFPTSNGEDYHGWYGLRVRQIMGNDIPTACSGHMPNVRRTLMVSAWAGSGASTQQTYRLNGNDLAPSGTSTGKGNAAYNTFTGSANYTASPNRPIDVVETIGYAPYVSGENLCTGADINCTPNSGNVPFYNALLTAYEAPNIPAAISLVDSDIRNGQVQVQTVTASGTTFTTPLAHGFTAASSIISFTVAGGTTYSGLVNGQLYQVDTTPTSSTFTMKAYANGVPAGSDINAGSVGSGTTSVGAISGGTGFTMLETANLLYNLWEPIAASYDAGRATPLRIENYEGGLEPQGPTQGQCTGLGIGDANCATNIAAAITAWKNSATGAATTLAYANQFLGKDSSMVPTFGLVPHSKTPAWLQLTGPNVWSLLPGDITSTPYQTYTGWSNVIHN